MYRTLAPRMRLHRTGHDGPEELRDGRQHEVCTARDFCVPQPWKRDHRCLGHVARIVLHERIPGVGLAHKQETGHRHLRQDFHQRGACLRRRGEGLEIILAHPGFHVGR